MSSGGGGGGGDSQTTVRYAGYVEDKHASLLNLTATAVCDVVDDSPFSGYTDIEVDDAFFGAGYSITSFPAMYDMYGKFMAGLDIEALWSQIYNDTLNNPVINDLIGAESNLLDDEVKENSLPRLQTGLRDINSVMSSSFVVGKSIIESTRTKVISKFSADLKYRLIPIAQERWNTHLNWNKIVIGTYAEIMKLYFSAKTDVDEVNYAMAVKNKLWPFTVLDFLRAAVGALQGATTSKTDVAGASTASRVISGALTGAAMGAMVGGQITNTAAVPAAAGMAAVPGTTYAGTGSLIGAGLGIASAYTY
ncbi:MAG: hypothetical protein ACTSQA_00465 [Candidatus Heimdallarchaeaceae archaeon]